MFYITKHIVRRYIERHAPQLSPQAALALLQKHAETAEFCDERALNGGELYALPALDVKFVVVVNDGLRAPRDYGLVAVTVLPYDSNRGAMRWAR